MLANGCAGAERVRGALGELDESEKAQSSNCRQLAGGPTLGLFLLVTASCRPFHQAVSSAGPQRGPVPII
jgi:hypothetical protein